MKKKANSQHTSVVISKVRDVMNMEVPEIIKNTVKAASEGLTGIIKSEPTALPIALGHIAQRLIADQHLNSVLIEWEKLRERGRIKDEYARSMQSKYTLLELLKFLEGDMPDEDRFQALKRIMLVAATEELSDRTSIKPQQFMQLIKSLPSGCVIVMLTTYRLSKNPPLKPDHNNQGNENQWLDVIAKESGLGQPELVANYEEILMQKRLLTTRRYPDGSGVKLDPHFRLTSLGYEIYTFIDHYDSFEF